MALFIIGVIFISSLISNNFTSNKTVQMASNGRLVVLELAFNRELEKDRQTLLAVATILAEDKEIKRHFSKRNRSKLHDHIVPLFDKLEKSNGVVFFNFILPNGKLFLRGHDPLSYGDKTTRISYHRAKKSKSFGIHIDSSKDGFVLSVVHACYLKGRLLGYLELARRVDHLTDHLKSMIKSENVFIKKKESVENSGSSGFLIVGSTLANPEKIVQKVYSGKTGLKFSKGLVEDDPYRQAGVVSGIIVVYDHMGRVIGNVISLMDISKVEEMIQKGRLITLIIVTLASFLSCFFLYLFIDRYIVKRVVKLTTMAGLVGQGDLTVREEVSVRNSDELDHLAKNFNKMVEDLGESTISSDYLNRIFNSLTEMLFIVSSKGRVEYANKKTIELLGFPEDVLLESHLNGILESVTPNQFPMNFVHLRNKIENKEVRDYSLSYRTKSGKSIPVLVSGATLVDNNKQVKIVLSAKDARESRLLRELQESQKQLIQAEKLASLGELSASLTHELNNPLSFIKGFNNRIRKRLEKQGSVTDNDIGDLIAEIEYGTQRMSKIIKNFRDFSRQSAIEMKVCSVNKAIEKVLELFEVQFVLKNIDVEKNLAGVDPLVYLDDNQLEQVFINLVSNARDALETSVNSIKKLAVSSHVEDATVHIAFSDTGEGMSESVLDKIFDPFFTTKEVGKGTGLGLAISHRIITDFQGRLSVKSTVGKGTTFYIKLPLVNS